MTRFVVPLLISTLVMTIAPNTANAQTNPAKPAPTTTNVNQKTISIELRDAPVRKALERLFDAVKADFVIEGTIKAGTVSARVKDKPFETVLKVILDSSSTPLTYERDGDVYIISLKPVPKPEPEAKKVAQAPEKIAPIEGNSTETGLDENQEAENTPNQGYYAPTYWTFPVPQQQQITPGLSMGWGGAQFGSMGYSPVNMGGPVFPGNTIFWNPQPGWGGYSGYGGGFLRFP